MLLFRTFLLTTFIAGLNLVSAARECRKIKECKNDLKNADGSLFDTIKYAFPNPDDFTDMCQKRESQYKPCMAAFDATKCSVRKTRDDGRLTEIIVDEVCDMERYLRVDRCLSPSNQRRLSHQVKQKCGPQIASMKRPVQGLSSLGVIGCKLADTFIECVKSTFHTCTPFVQGFYGGLIRKRFGYTCDEYFRFAEEIYKKVASLDA